MALDVSVVVPSYQGASRLRTLLKALASQETSCAWEVVLVLDGSTDDSSQVARRFAGEIDLTVHDRGFNAGRSVTLNEGFAVARGDVLIRCDDDLVPGPAYIETFAQTIAKHQSVGLVGLYRNDYPATPYSEKYGYPVDERFRSEAYAMPLDRRWLVWAGNCGVHRQMWEKVGPYDDRTFRAYGWEDIDWGYRFQRAGGHIVLDPRLETPHRVAATTCAVRCERALASGAAARLFDDKHGTQSLPVLEGYWGAVIGQAAQRVTTRAWANVDRALPVLPSAAGRKLVDLAIQSQFRRGYLTQT